MDILLALIANYVDNVFISVENQEDQLSIQRKILPDVATLVNVAVRVQNSTTSIVPKFVASTAIFYLTNNVTRLLSDGIIKLLTGTRQVSFILFVIWTGSEVDFSSCLPQLASNFTLDSDVFGICEGSLNVWEAYSIKGEPLVLQAPFKLDDADLAAKLTSLKYTSARRRNFRQISVVATAPDDPGYSEEVNLSQDWNGAKFLDDGIAVDVYRIFQDYLNFSEVLIEGAYMLEKAPPTNRMQAHLKNGKADLSIALSTVEENKAEFVQFLHPAAATWLDIRFMEPKTMWTFFTRPFELPLWRTTATYVILLFIVITFMQWALSKTVDFGNPENLFPSHYCNVLFMLGTFCIQGWYKWPSSHTVRITMTVATVVGLTLNVAYTGVLTAQLAIKKPSTVTIEKLLDRKASIGLEDDVSFPIDLEEFPQWRDVKVYTVFENEPQALKAVMEGKEAWIIFPEYYHSVIEMSNYSDHEACELTSAVRAGNRPTLTAMAVNKTSELKQVFDYLTVKLLEQGLLARLIKKYKGKRILKCVHDQRNLQTPALLDLALAFIILCAGIVSSTLALSAEAILHYICTSIIFQF